MLDDRKQSMRDIAPGMDVCDVSGEKVGTVARVHRPAAAQEVVEVKTGPFGFGKHLYVPAEEVDGVTEAGLILRHPKQEFHEVGLDTRLERLARCVTVCRGMRTVSRSKARDPEEASALPIKTPPAARGLRR